MDGRQIDMMVQSVDWSQSMDSFPSITIRGVVRNQSATNVFRQVGADIYAGPEPYTVKPEPVAVNPELDYSSVELPDWSDGITT
jgi:hypothetical protein